MTDYDVIIIGSGIGGSAAAAMMAHAGYKTLLLEKNSFVGGVTSSYQKEGFTIDVAIHFFPAGFRGRFGKIFRRIGMRETTSLKFASHLENRVGLKILGQDEIIKTSSVIKMVMPKGPSSGTKSSGPGLNLKSMGFSKDDQKEIMNILFMLLRMSKKKIKPLYEEKCTVTEYINRFTKNPTVHGLIAFITGGMFTISPRIASAAEFIRCFQEMSLTMDLSYPYGGSISIPRAFLESLEHYGGKSRMNARVSKILVDDGKAQGVVVNDEEITSDLILSNAGIKNTIHLVGEQYFEKSYRERVKNLVPSYSSITFKAALKKPLIPDLAMLNLFPGELSTLESEATSGRKAKSTGFMTVIPSNCDPSLAPKGRQLMIFGTMSPGEGVQDWGSWTKAYYRNLLEYLPELDDLNLFIDSTTPQDLVKVSGKAFGPVEATALTPDQVGPYRISSKTPIDGLYVVGDSAGTNTSGIGTQLAADSALKCVDLILKKN